MYRERRSLHKSISQSHRVNELSLLGALIYTWMIPHYDDYGRMDGDPQDVQFNILPRRRDISKEDFIRELIHMEDLNLIHWYVVAGKPYIEMDPDAWEERQTFKGIKRSSKIKPYISGKHGLYRDVFPDECPPKGVDRSTQRGGQVHPKGWTPEKPEKGNGSSELSTGPPKGVDRSTQQGVQVHPSRPTREVKGSKEKRFTSVNQPEVVPPKNGHFKKQAGEWAERIVDLCRKLQAKSNGTRKFNPWQWVQKKFKEGGVHPMAIVEALEGLLEYWSTLHTSPWAYADHIYQVRNQNYSEKAFIQDSQGAEQAFNEFCKTPQAQELFKLIEFKGMGDMR